ncbi:MAG: hypothetical protein JSW70_04600 [Syntrophobacterales bacterium]|nr:MAG: hypothetical protein JSW70_04600 [Syntrophobacterales bacterium]
MMKRGTKRDEGGPPEEGFECPFCLFFSKLKEMGGRKPEFWGHMNNARIEFLEGIKFLIDDRIETLKRTRERKKGKSFSKIEVGD